MPHKIPKRDAKGNDVVLLQVGLKMANFNFGTSDGDFGARTENCLKQFQSTVSELEISGIFDHETKNFYSRYLMASIIISEAIVQI